VKAKVLYRDIKEVFPPPPMGTRPQPMNIHYSVVDLHEIEDHDSVMRDAYGYLSIVNVDGDVFMYPTANVVKVEITP
jgi:hypothetical protein